MLSSRDRELAQFRGRNNKIISVQGTLIDLARIEITEGMKAAFVNGKFERTERKILQKTLCSTDKVLELGASTGFLSIIAALICGPQNVFSYEANPYACNLARHHYTINRMPINLTEGILMPRSGVDQMTRYLYFYLRKELVSGSLSPTSQATSSVKVPVLLAEDEIERRCANYLLVDIEGGEHEFFTKIARCPSVNKILMEQHSRKIGYARYLEVLKSLHSLGFSCRTDISQGNVDYFERS